MGILLKSLSKKAARAAEEALAKKSARAAELEGKAAEAYAQMPEYLQDPYLGLSTSNIGKVTKSVLNKVPRMSKAESEAAGLYHPIGNKIKLKKPVSEMTETIIPNPEVTMTAPRILTPEDLYGKAGIPLIGDRAATGKILTHIDDRPLNRPVTLEGGPEFMLAHHYPEDPMGSSVWASGKGKVTALNNRIREAAESGDDVLGIYSAGSPVQVDYNAMLSHTLANQINLDAIKKSDIKKFNKAIREKFPEFVGIEHPDLDIQLGQKSSGPLRSHFVDRMRLEDFQDAGFPNIAQARKAITEPSLLDVPLGSTGFTVGRMNPEGAIVEAPRMPHGTYAIHMQGTPEGRLETQLPYDVMFKTHTDARKMMPGSTPQTVYRSYELTQPIQYFDQEWLDNAMKYLDEIEKKKGYAEGGEVLKEEPRGKVSGAIADILKPASDFLGQYEVKDYVPLLGGTDLAELTGIKGTQSLAEDISRGYSPVHGGSLQTSKFDPRLIDAASLLPGIGPIMKGAKSIGRTALEQGAKNIAEGRLVPGLMVNPRMNIIKDPGGMLVGGEKALDDELSYMKKPERFYTRTTTDGVTNEVVEEQPNSVALNNWINTKVRKYLRNQAGSENDPILKAIESGVEHNFTPALGDTKYAVKNKRALVGKPEEGIAKTDLGKEWEYKVDSIFNPKSSKEIKDILNSPMEHVPEEQRKRRMASLLRVEQDLPITYDKDLEALKLINEIPDKNVYTLSGTNITERLGLKHISDVLHEDLQSGRLKPEQLDQMSIEKAVRRAAEYDAQKAREMVKAHATSVEGMPVPKQYDDGFKWVELKHGTDKEKTKAALKSEGEMMGHCVGSYCPQVESGHTKIYSLRGPDNKSHVTIEASKKNHLNDWLEANKEEIEKDPLLKQMAYYDPDEKYPGMYSEQEVEQAYIDDITKMLRAKGAPVHEAKNSWVEIQQIKGKQNKRPDDKYQKYVSDFLKNNPTGHDIADIHELENTNLHDVQSMVAEGVMPKKLHMHPIVDKAVGIDQPHLAVRMNDPRFSNEITDEKFNLFKNIGRDFASKGKYYVDDEDILNAIREKHLKQPTPGHKNGGVIQLKIPSLRRKYG